MFLYTTRNVTSSNTTKPQHSIEGAQNALLFVCTKYHSAKLRPNPLQRCWWWRLTCTVLQTVSQLGRLFAVWHPQRCQVVSRSLSVFGRDLLHSMCQVHHARALSEPSMALVLWRMQQQHGNDGCLSHLLLQLPWTRRQGPLQVTGKEDLDGKFLNKVFREWYQFGKNWAKRNWLMMGKEGRQALRRKLSFKQRKRC